MLTFIRSNSTFQNFITLVSQLDVKLAEIDGDEHDFCTQYNKIDKIKHVVAFENELPIACRAIKLFDNKTVEVKRMYTLAEFRAKGASSVLNELENLAAKLGYNRCVIETGVRQPNAISSYIKNGYFPIPNYGQYVGVEKSRCFEKKLYQIK